MLKHDLPPRWDLIHSNLAGYLISGELDPLIGGVPDGTVRAGGQFL